jgi:hypothetical protein
LESVLLAWPSVLCWLQEKQKLQDLLIQQQRVKQASKALWLLQPVAVLVRWCWPAQQQTGTQELCCVC